MSEELTEQEMLELSKLVGATPTADEKQNVHTFLHNVATALDTTKTGFLRDDKDLNEIGIPRLPVRAYKKLALISKEIMGNTFFEDYFKAEAEILTSTSLSREGFLDNLAIIQRKEVADVTKRKIENKGWFKKKTPNN